MQPYTDYIFGYGSLVDLERLRVFLGRERLRDGDACYAALRGYRRAWNVAMDNRLDLPGYKYYVDAQTGQRPAGYVVFLNIYPAAESSIAGVLFGVTPAELQQVDQRERNYERVEIAAHLDCTDCPAGGRVWVYQGLPEAQQRYQQGVRRGEAMISQQYAQQVQASYQAAGAALAANYAATTDPPLHPLRALRVVSL